MPVKKEVTSNKKQVISKKTEKVIKKTDAVKSQVKIATPRTIRYMARNDRKITGSVSLSVPVYSLAGKEAGTLALPKEIFGQKVNKKLLAQALRVYITNQKSLSGSTKTRGEVAGSTAKIYRQKGTGRARHGAIRAPIFVGGGIVFGPKPRKVRLSLPQNMKRAALLQALSSKVSDKNILGLSGLEQATGKTKEMVKLVFSVVSSQSSDKKQKQKSALIVTDKKMDNVVRSVRNIPGISVLPANLINAYEVLKHELLLVTKEAVEKFSKKESRVESQESRQKGGKTSP